MTLTLTADNGDVLWTDPDLTSADFTFDKQGRVLFKGLISAIHKYQEEVDRAFDR